MSSLETIPLLNLALTLIPALIVVAIMYRWALGSGTALYAISRMLIQLMLVGYVLAYIFETDTLLTDDTKPQALSHSTRRTGLRATDLRDMPIDLMARGSDIVCVK